jgi:predicted ATPase/DNA-binding winged helix-turn-helix (wHTH) protein
MTHELTLHFGPFRLIPSLGLLFEGDRPLQLGNRALTILQILTDRAGEVVEKEELARLVWPTTFVDETNLRVHISALRRALGDGHDGSRYIVNIPGRGYRFAATVERLLDGPALERKTSPTFPLPHGLTRLIGRNVAVEKLKAELTRERMITIVGSGGIGKTSLVLAATPSWLTDSGYDVHFVDVALVSEPSTVATTVASVILGTKVHEDVVVALLNELWDRRLLIILDNCEHVIPAVARLCETLLSSTQFVKFIATSREALRIPGEWIHRLSALPTPPADQTITAAEALRYPSVQLFVERAIANVDIFEFRDPDVAAVGNICRRLDGVPLSIEFAAARVDLFDVHSIAERLDDRFTLLTKGSRNALPRQESLLAVLEWSCGLLSADRKIVLSRLSVFAGYFGVDDAIDVVHGDGISRQAALESLSDLVAKSMLLADASGPSVSYRLLETTRAYAYEKLKEAGEANVVHRRHAQRFLGACKMLATLEADHHILRQTMVDVRVALDWSFGPNGDAILGVDLAAAATPIILQLTALREYRRYIEIALNSLAEKPDSEKGDSDIRAEISLRTAQALAVIFLNKGYAELQDRLERARKLSIDTGDTAHELRVLWLQYGIAFLQGNYDRALERAELYSARADKSAEKGAHLVSCRLRGGALGDLGRYAEAQELLEKALRIDRKEVTGVRINAYEMDQWVAARAKLLKILWLRGQPDDAKAEAHQCLAEAQKVGQEQMTCFALAFHIIPVFVWRGDLNDAMSFVSQLLKLSHNVSYHYQEWGLLYRQFLDAVTSATNRSGMLSEVSHIAKVPAHADMLATFDVTLLRPDVLARARANHAIWIAPEVLRASAHRLVTGTKNFASTSAEATLLRSLELARSQGAKGWELRSATSLALLYKRRHRRAEAYNVLEDVLNRFTQGYDTKDVKTAVQLLSELG